MDFRMQNWSPRSVKHLTDGALRGAFSWPLQSASSHHRTPFSICGFNVHLNATYSSALIHTSRSTLSLWILTAFSPSLLRNLILFILHCFPVILSTSYCVYYIQHTQTTNASETALCQGTEVEEEAAGLSCLLWSLGSWPGYWVISFSYLLYSLSSQTLICSHLNISKTGIPL